MIKLENDFLSVLISHKGAELKSIYSKKENREYLWQAEPEYWSRSSPVLFPIIGKMRNNKVAIDNKEFSIEKHGFARDTDFIVESSLENKVILKIDFDKIKNRLPFDYDFFISYELVNNKIVCNYLVKNKGEEEMCFSVGAHPAFNIDVESDKDWEDYYLTFKNDERISRYFIKNDLLELDPVLVELNANRLFLKKEMFDDDAWVLKKLKSNSVKLNKINSNFEVKLEFENFPYFGIWSAKESSFICLEPWCGVNDNLYSKVELEYKEGINKLSSFEKWERNWSISIGTLN